MKRPSPYINRELSWLDFNGRVLEEAEDESNPLVERLKFLAIFSSNLNEFYMIRVGGLLDQSLAGLSGEDDITRMSPGKQLDEIFRKTAKLVGAYNAVQHSLFLAAAKKGIRYIRLEKPSANEKQHIYGEFNKTAMPLVSTIIVDSKHPFPYLPSGCVFIAARIKGKNREKLGLVLFPESAEKLIFVGRGDLSFFLVEDAAEVFAGNMFPRQELLETGKFRVTRNADMAYDEGDAAGEDSYKAVMERVLEIRRRLNPVRLETDLPPSSGLTQEISRRFNLTPQQVFTLTGPLDMSFIYRISDTAKLAGHAECFFPEMKSLYAPGLRRQASVIAQIRYRDFIMIHPYVNFEAVLALLREAAYDESVIAIRQTLYRVSNNSEVIRYLLEAANNGKEVTVLVELKARFDEANNINWAAKLEAAGCRIIYGRDYIKVHSKLLLITRKTAKGIAYTAHISTGNYNEDTANLYTDIGILTSNEEIAHDITLFFRELGAGKTDEEYRIFDVSPESLRIKLYSLIDNEIKAAQSGGAGRIIMKMNALADRGIIDKLIEASNAGVKTELLVRGICCLKAGIPKVTENIRVVSVVGRFLEHSRVFWFLSGGDEKLFISSADLMTRNLNRRMEIMCPVLDSHIAGNIKDMILILLKDAVKGRIMCPDGSYRRRETPDGGADAQAKQYLKCLEDFRNQLPVKKSLKRRVLRRALGFALLKLGKKISPDYPV
jgi:polyphosphate kinase